MGQVAAGVVREYFYAMPPRVFRVELRGRDGTCSSRSWSAGSTFDRGGYIRVTV